MNQYQISEHWRPVHELPPLPDGHEDRRGKLIRSAHQNFLRGYVLHIDHAEERAIYRHDSETWLSVSYKSALKVAEEMREFASCIQHTNQSRSMTITTEPKRRKRQDITLDRREYTARELADLMGVSDATVRNYQHRLTYRVGGRNAFMFQVDEKLVTWLRERGHEVVVPESLLRRADTNGAPDPIEASDEPETASEDVEEDAVDTRYEDYVTDPELDTAFPGYAHPGPDLRHVHNEEEDDLVDDVAAAGESDDGGLQERAAIEGNREATELEYLRDRIKEFEERERILLIEKGKAVEHAYRKGMADAEFKAAQSVNAISDTLRRSPMHRVEYHDPSLDDPAETAVRRVRQALEQLQRVALDAELGDIGKLEIELERVCAQTSKSARRMRRAARHARVYLRFHQLFVW